MLSVSVSHRIKNGIVIDVNKSDFVATKTEQFFCSFSFFVLASETVFAVALSMHRIKFVTTLHRQARSRARALIDRECGEIKIKIKETVKGFAHDSPLRSTKIKRKKKIKKIKLWEILGNRSSHHFEFRFGFRSFLLFSNFIFDVFNSLLTFFSSQKTVGAVRRSKQRWKMCNITRLYTFNCFVCAKWLQQTTDYNRSNENVFVRNKIEKWNESKFDCPI